MNVIVKLNDGNKIYPIFEPTTNSLFGLVEFYSEKFVTKEILGYEIKSDAGEVLALAGDIS